MTSHNGKNSEKNFRCLWLILAGLLGFCGAVSCRSTDPNVPRSASLASITVTNRTTDDIRETAIEVFKENLFGVTYAGVNNLVFEKQGGWMKEVAYGGWMDSSVWTRVKVDISLYATNRHLVACDAFIVRDRGDSFFEDETKLRKLSKGPYQKMLDQVKARLEMK